MKRWLKKWLGRLFWTHLCFLYIFLLWRASQGGDQGMIVLWATLFSVSLVLSLAYWGVLRSLFLWWEKDD